jgi:hypothetical protein
MISDGMDLLTLATTDKNDCREQKEMIDAAHPTPRKKTVEAPQPVWEAGLAMHYENFNEWRTSAALIFGPRSSSMVHGLEKTPTKA